MTTSRNGDPVGQALTQARQYVQRTNGDLDRLARDPRTAHATVAGVYYLAEALAGLVDALRERLSAAEPDDAGSTNAVDEVVADLRAMHGCLSTGVLLLEPALADLRGLSRSGAAASVGGAPMVCDEAPEADRADQQYVLGSVPDAPGDTAPEATLDNVTSEVVAEADPADRTEQQRPVARDDSFQV